MTDFPMLLPKVEDLETLPKERLIAIKKLLDKYFLKSRTNVYLHNALRKKESREFKKKVASVIKTQILHIAQLDIISQYKKKENPEIDEWLPFEDVVGKNTLLFFLLFAAGLGGQMALDKMGVDLQFVLKDKKLIDSLRKRVDYLYNTLDNTGRGWFFQNVESGRKNDLTAVQIVREIRNKAEQTALMRGELITETELSTVMNLTEVEVYKKNGIGFVKWVATNDERTCEVCLANEAAGETEIGTEFPMGQEQPPAHMRCACYLLPVLPKEFHGNIWIGE